MVDLVKGIGVTALTPKLLLAVLQALPELDRMYTPMFSRGPGREAAWPQSAVATFGITIVHMLQRFAPDNLGYLARCKRACVISDWIEGVPAEDIERTYTTQIYAAPLNYGDIRNIADTTRFHLRSAREIVSLLLISSPAFEQEIDNLLMQLEAGLPADTLDLLALPIPLHRGDRLALRSAGIKTREQLWQMQREMLEGILGRSISKQLELLRPVDLQPTERAADNAA